MTTRKSCADADRVEAVAEAANFMGNALADGLGEPTERRSRDLCHRSPGHADDHGKDCDQCGSGEGKQPGAQKISWCGRSRGANNSAPEKISAAAPRSNMRSMV